MNLKTAGALRDGKAKNSQTIKQLIKEHRAVSTDTGLMGPGLQSNQSDEETQDKPSEIVANYEMLIKQRKDKRKIPRLQKSRKTLNVTKKFEEIESMEQLFLR